MALSKKRFAQLTYTITDNNLANDPTKASGLQKLVLESAYGVYATESKKQAIKCETEKNTLRYEITELKVALQAQHGETEVERTRLQAIGFLAKRGFIQLGEVATKPFIEYLPPATQDESPKLNTAAETPNIKDVEEENGGVSSDNKPSDKTENRLSLQDELPKGWRFPIAIVSRFFERLSPLTTAILFALVISGGAAFGKFNSYVANQRLESEKELVDGYIKVVADYEEKVQGLENTELKFKKLLPESESLRRDIGTLSTEKARLEEKMNEMAGQHQEVLRKKLEEYEASIALYRDKEKGAAATEAAKQATTILKFNQELGELKGENSFLVSRVKKLETEYETTTAEEKAAQNEAVIVNNELTELRRSLRVTNAEKRELVTLLSQLTEALYSVEKHFGKNDLSLEARRACYRVHYVSIAERFSEKAGNYKLPSDLNVDRYNSIGDYPRRWLRQCP